MKIVAISDMHGYLPHIPPCDVLCIAGDVCCHGQSPVQRNWLLNHLAPWLREVPAQRIVACAGNHDWALIDPPDLPWELLTDRSITIGGLKFHGSPWQPVFGNWAFNARPESLTAKFSAIPEDVDVLVTHGPPFGIGDAVAPDAHVGSKELSDRVAQLTSLKLHVFGHIHEGRGVYGRFANVTLLNEYYEPVYFPMEFEI
jgi:Icc-related predicted phosphoesterase